MYLWLDDIRPMPRGFSYWAKTGSQAIELLMTGKVEFISFDHDLGHGLTGYDVAKYIEECAFRGEIPPLKWRIHSANPVGRRNIQQAMLNAEKYWNEVLHDESDYAL